MIGLAVITYNRPDYCLKVLESLIANNCGGANKVIVIDDNSTISYKHIISLLYQTNISFYTNSTNRGVAHSKNKAFKLLLEAGCDHIFLMEDDILMVDPDTCGYYISSAERFKVQHLNFGLHGTMNTGKGFWKDGVFCYPDCVGAFSYYSREVLEKVGLMDENFKNAWEHVEHTYRIIEAGYHPEFWNFADCPISDELLKEIPGSIDNSVIRPRSDWMENIQRGRIYWDDKHGSWLPPRPKRR